MIYLAALKPVYIYQPGIIITSKKKQKFFCFLNKIIALSSDIDLVVFGDWSTLPLIPLRDALIREAITDRDNIKVLDKASVSDFKY